MPCLCVTLREGDPSAVQGQRCGAAVAVHRSICWRSAGRRRRSREVNSFGPEVMLIKRSEQPPAPAADQVAGACSLCPAVVPQTRLLQSGDGVGAVPHRTALDSLHPAVRDEPREGRPRAPLEIVEDRFDLRVGRAVVESLGDRGRCGACARTQANRRSVDRQLSHPPSSFP